MTHANKILSILTAATAMTGCVKEDRSNCPPEATPVTPVAQVEEVLVVRAVDIVSGTDITGTGAVESASLYVFDAEGNFLTRVDVAGDEMGEEIEIPLAAQTRAAAGDKLQISAWGNINAGIACQQEITTEHDIDHTFIDLNQDEENDDCMKCPGNTFFGLKEITLGQQETRAAETQVKKITHIVPITQKSARLHITVRGLPAGARADDYYFKLCNQADGYTFEGEPVDDDQRDIIESGVFNAAHDFVSPQPYYLVPTCHEDVTEENCALIHVMRRAASRAGEGDTDLSGQVKTDENGKYITLVAGQTTNVLIVFGTGGNVEVRVEMTPWNKVYQWNVW